MKHEIRNFVVGLVALFGILGTIAAGIFLATGTGPDPDSMIETYLRGTVPGLKKGQSVSFHGLRLGRVEKVAFVGDAYGIPPGEAEAYYVMVRIELEADSYPIPHPDSEEHRAELNRLIEQEGLRLRVAKGIVGVIDFEFIDPKLYTPIEVDWEPETFYVPAVFASEDDVQKSATAFMEKIGAQLDPILKNFKAASEKLPDITTRLDAILYHLNDIVVYRKNDLEDTVHNFKLTSKELRDLSERAKASPTQVLFGSPPPRSRFDK